MIKSITIDVLEKCLAAKPCHVIDVREVDEFAAGHIPGAINLPLSELVHRYQELPTNQPYHIICQAGGRSAQACAFLDSKGYDVTNINGGTNAWSSKLEK